jgi:hypothetical protein
MRATLFVLAAVLIGCGEKPLMKPKVEAPRLPVIKHFYGNEAVVPKGGSLTLCYGTENVDSLTLTPYDDGELRPSFNRCVAHAPAGDTTYVLRAKGPGGETTATFSVKVGKPAPKDKIMIQNFTVVGNTPVAPGGRVQLCYTTDGANTVSLRPPAKVKLEPGKNQCFIVTPDKSTNYVLTATAVDGGVDRMQVSVPVQ